MATPEVCLPCRGIMSLSSPLSHALLKELRKLKDAKERGLILDRHFETVKEHVKVGNSVATGRWDAIESGLELRQTDVFSEEEWVTQIDGEVQGIASSTRLSLPPQQDAGGARGAPSQHPPDAAAPAAKKRKFDRGKKDRERAAHGTLGGNILNAFAIGSGKPIERTRGGVKELVSGISFPPPAPGSRRQCPHCPMTFVNEQGLGTHVSTQHSTANMYNGLRLQRMLGQDPNGSVLPWEQAGPGRCWRVKIDGATGAASFVLQRKSFLHMDLDSDGFAKEDQKPKATRGAKQRNRYSFRFKAHVINQLRILQEKAEELWRAEQLTPAQYLEYTLKVHHSLISKWAKEEDENVRLAADDVMKNLMAKQQPKGTHP
ncbi:unnamed protein product [Pylaiella littoralis]